MFQSAGHKTWRKRVWEVVLTVALMRFCVWVAISILKASGLAAQVDLSHTPFLGVSTNYLLPGFNFDPAQGLTSPWVIMVLLIAVVGAPFVEEITFRWFVCRSLASDPYDNLISVPEGKGLGIVLVGSFIVFGLLHGQGYFSLMIQGVGGLLLARLWFRNGPDLKTAYFSCVAAHSFYNLSVAITEFVS